SSFTAKTSSPVPESVAGPLPTCTHGPEPTLPTSPQPGAPGATNPPKPLCVVSADASPSGPKHDPVPGQTVPVAVTVTESPFSTRPVDAPGTAKDPTVYTLVTVDGPPALCAAATSATKAATTNADPLRLLMIPLS